MTGFLLNILTAYFFYKLGKQKAFKECAAELERNISILKNQNKNK